MNAKAAKLDINAEPTVRIRCLRCVEIILLIHGLLHLFKILSSVTLDQFTAVDVPKLRLVQAIICNYVSLILQNVIFSYPWQAF